jgi:circadian clock protein KaiB
MARKGDDRAPRRARRKPDAADAAGTAARTRIDPALGRALGAQARLPRYVLKLYVTGLTPNSARAIDRVRAICEEHLRDRYELEVIDIYQLPALAKGEQIVATPTLIRVLPKPLRRYIGDLSAEKLVFGLDLRERS